jgi:hypothetical protein
MQWNVIVQINEPTGALEFDLPAQNRESASLLSIRTRRIAGLPVIAISGTGVAIL